LPVDVLKDDIGPEYVVELYDPATGTRGFLVIDTMVYGVAAGGVRMLPDVTVGEVSHLARAMTYKFATYDMPIGGAKGGIVADPSSPDRDRHVGAFARLVAPFLKQLVYIPGADMGTSDRDVAVMYEVAGMEQFKPSGLTLKVKDGMPLEDHLTGYGVVVAAKTAAELVNMSIEGASVAVEGFGKVGGGVARYMEKLGARVVAISTIHGAIYNPKGLDVEGLLEARRKHGDRVVLEYKDAERIAKEKIFTLPVDVLVPGARPHVIDKNNAGDVKAKIISPGANIPTTLEAEEILFRKGVLSIPDFVANAGGIIAATMDRMSATEEKAFEAVESNISSVTRKIISQAMEEKTYPLAVAVRMAKEKVKREIEKKERMAAEEIERKVKEKFGV